VLDRRRLVPASLALALALAGCGKDEAQPAAASAATPPSAAPAATPSVDASDTRTLLSATLAFAEGNCSVVRRKLEVCAACETPEQKPKRDLLLAYCQERTAPAEARALYEAIVTAHPNTEASNLAIMRVRQIDAAELPPLSDYAGPKPTPIQRYQPAYPTLASQAGIEGSVRLRFDVQADGSVANVRVVESTPPLLFDSVALYAVSSWEYEKGQAAESQQVVLRFDLPDEDVAAARAAAGEAPAPGSAAQ
jgi:TonB family protein